MLNRTNQTSGPSYFRYSGQYLSWTPPVRSHTKSQSARQKCWSLPAFCENQTVSSTEGCSWKLNGVSPHSSPHVSVILSTLYSDVVALFGCHTSPLLLLLSLSQFSNDESQDQQPHDDYDHTQGQRCTQGPVDRALAELTRVSQVAVACQVNTVIRRGYTGPVAAAVIHSTGRRTYVEALR